MPRLEGREGHQGRGARPAPAQDYAPPRLRRYGSLLELTRADQHNAGTPDGQPCKAGIFCFFWKSL